MLKLFGLADLGIVQQHDGVLSTYAGEPLTITGEESQVRRSPSPLLEKRVRIGEPYTITMEAGEESHLRGSPSSLLGRMVKFGEEQLGE